MRRIDTYTLNKVAGWVLFTALLVFGLNELSHIVYHAETPEQPGMVVEVAEVTTEAEDAGEGEQGPSLASLLAEAGAEDGEAASRACQACHTFGQGEPHRVGPNLWGVVGSQIAHHEDYSYSDALAGMSDQTWTFEALDDFLANPRGFAPGTKMTYGGMGRDEQRADLLVYLRSLSEDPQPLPEPTAAEEEPEQEAQDQPDETAESETAEAQDGADAGAPAAEQETVGQIESRDGEPSDDQPQEGADADAPAAEREPVGQIETRQGEPSADQPQQQPVGRIERVREPDQAEEVTQAEPAEPQQAEGEAGQSTPEAVVAAGDPESGQAAARQCQACHTFEQGEPHRVGPNLWGVVGAQIARHDDYDYSDALQQMSDQAWTPEALDQYIANPREFAPGTKMTYGGMRREEQRSDLIAYLRTLGGD